MKKVLLSTIALVFSVVAFGQNYNTNISEYQECDRLKIEQKENILLLDRKNGEINRLKRVIENQNRGLQYKTEEINYLKTKDSSNTPIRVDSMVCFNRIQEKVIIKQLKTIEIKDSLNNQLEKKVVKQQEIINNKDLQILDQKTIIDNKQFIIIDKDKEIVSKDNEIKGLKIQRNFFIKGTIFSSLVVIVLILL